MPTEYTTISLSVQSDTVDMLRQLARWLHGREDRVVSMTADQIIRERYEQEKAKREQGQRPQE